MIATTRAFPSELRPERFVCRSYRFSIARLKSAHSIPPTPPVHLQAVCAHRRLSSRQSSGEAASLLRATSLQCKRTPLRRSRTRWPRADCRSTVESRPDRREPGRPNSAAWQLSSARPVLTAHHRAILAKVSAERRVIDRNRSTQSTAFERLTLAPNEKQKHPESRERKLFASLHGRRRARRRYRSPRLRIRRDV